MKEWMLDTDTLSYFLKGNKSLLEKIDQYHLFFGYINISVIVYYEIMNGLLFKNANRQLQIFEPFMDKTRIFPVTTEIALIAAEIYAKLRRSNQMIGHTDVLIAATAIHHNFGIVTNNLSHFSRIPGLELENWIG